MHGTNTTYTCVIINQYVLFWGGALMFFFLDISFCTSLCLTLCFWNIFLVISGDLIHFFQPHYSITLVDFINILFIHCSCWGALEIFPIFNIIICSNGHHCLVLHGLKNFWRYIVRNGFAYSRGVMKIYTSLLCKYIEHFIHISIFIQILNSESPVWNREKHSQLSFLIRRILELNSTHQTIQKTAIKKTGKG